MTIDELNRKDRADFVDAVGWVFEDSPWVADRAWTRRPFRSLDHLHEAMTSEVDGASAGEQLGLLRAHPDLGSGATMSTASVEEQAEVGLDALTPAELERFAALNGAYKDRFGFPFLYAVRGGTKQDILGALERRLRSTSDAEIAEGLRQVYRIARYRLEDLIS